MINEEQNVGKSINCQEFHVRTKLVDLFTVSPSGFESLQTAKSFIDTSSPVFRENFRRLAKLSFTSDLTVWKIADQIVPSFEIFVLLVTCWIMILLIFIVLVNMNFLSKLDFFQKLSRNDTFRIALTYIPVNVVFLAFSTSISFYWYLSYLLNNLKNHSNFMEFSKNDALNNLKMIYYSYDCFARNMVETKRKKFFTETFFSSLNSILPFNYDDESILFSREKNYFFQCLKDSLPEGVLHIPTLWTDDFRQRAISLMALIERKIDKIYRFEEINLEMALNNTIHDFYDVISQLENNFLHLNDIPKIEMFCKIAFFITGIAISHTFLIIYLTYRKKIFKNLCFKIYLYLNLFLVIIGTTLLPLLFLYLLATSSVFVSYHQLLSHPKFSPLNFVTQFSRHNTSSRGGFGSQYAYTIENMVKISYNSENIVKTLLKESNVDNENLVKKMINSIVDDYYKSLRKNDFIQLCDKLEKRKLKNGFLKCDNPYISLPVKRVKKICKKLDKFFTFAEQHTFLFKKFENNSLVTEVFLNQFVEEVKQDLKKIPIVKYDFYLMDTFQNYLLYFENRFIVPISVMLRMSIFSAFAVFVLVMYSSLGIRMISEDNLDMIKIKTMENDQSMIWFWQKIWILLRRGEKKNK